MEVIYLHHSGFLLKQDKVVVVIDFFEDSIDRHHGILHDMLPLDYKFYFLSSHFHEDHFCRDIIEFNARNKTYILSSDIKKRRSKYVKGLADTHFLKKGDIFADDTLKVEAFGSTDVGISFAIDFAGFKIFHAGDLNNWHWKLESIADEIKEAEDFYSRELSDIVEKHSYFDLVLFPVDPRMGDDISKGALEFCQSIECKYFIPMHVWDNFARANQDAQLIENTAFHPRFLKVVERGQSFNF